MNKQQKKILNIFTRYAVIIILGLNNLYIIYKILTPTTIFITYKILSIFTNPILIKNTLFLKETIIEIVPACVAGSAFYLLIILILSTPNMKIKTRIEAILFSTTTLLILNIARIIILTHLTSSPSFETIHWIFWHLISIIFVVSIWLATSKIFKIKSIPIYSDLIHIKKLIKPAEKSKRKPKDN